MAIRIAVIAAAHVAYAAVHGGWSLLASAERRRCVVAAGCCEGKNDQVACFYKAACVAAGAIKPPVLFARILCLALRRFPAGHGAEARHGLKRKEKDTFFNLYVEGKVYCHTTICTIGVS